MPQRVVAGIGCRRDTPFPLLAALLARQLEAQRFDPLALKAIGSVSLKKDEEGLIQLASCWRVPFETLPLTRCVSMNITFRPHRLFARRSASEASRVRQRGC